jgi:hypothetical protein
MITCDAGALYDWRKYDGYCYQNILALINTAQSRRVNHAGQDFNQAGLY